MQLGMLILNTNQQKEKHGYSTLEYQHFVHKVWCQIYKMMYDPKDK